MKSPRHDRDGDRQNMIRLTHLYHLALLDAERPGNNGAGVKVLEALIKLPPFRPRTRGVA